MSLAELTLEVTSILRKLTAHYHREKSGCSLKMVDPGGGGVADLGICLIWGLVFSHFNRKKKSLGMYLGSQERAPDTIPHDTEKNSSSDTEIHAQVKILDISLFIAQMGALYIIKLLLSGY